MPTEIANEIISPFTDIPTQPLEEKSNTRYGSDFFRDVNELQVGMGSKVLRADQQGLWLGAETFASAPFSVDMEGNVVANNITLGGYIPTGGAVGDVQTTIGGGGLSAISANIGSITAGTITGVTITGGTLQTATSGRRIKISSSPANSIEFYDSSTLYGVLEADKVGTDGYINLVAQDDGAGLSVYTGVGASAFSSTTVFSNGGSFDTSGNASNGFNVINGKYGGYFMVFGDGSAVDRIATDLEVESDWIPSADNSYDLGSSGKKWSTLYALTVSGLTTLSVSGTISGTTVNVNSVPVPRIYTAYCSGTTLSKQNVSAFSLSNPSTGNYTLTHNWGSSNYNIQATALRASGSGAYVAKVATLGTNDFTIIIFDDTGAAVNGDFMIAVFRN